MRVPLFLTGLLLAVPAFAATPQETVQKAMSVLAPGVKVPFGAVTAPEGVGRGLRHGFAGWLRQLSRCNNRSIRRLLHTVQYFYGRRPPSDR